MFGPLAFGSVEPWSIFILEAGATCLALLWLAKQWLDGEIKIKANPLFLPMASFGLLILIQIIFRATAYRHDTVSGALLYCAYGMLCFLSGQTLLRTAQAADIAGIRALVVHAKDEQARGWYGQFDFDPSPTDPLHLFLVMKDLKRLILSSEEGSPWQVL